MIAIKIYGERNSGTNFLEELVRRNIDAEILRFYPSKRIGRYLKYEFLSGWLFEYHKKEFLGWKHGKPRVKAINNYKSHQLLIITVTKNPYSFLLSLKKRPYHYRGNRDCDFNSFLKAKWEAIIRDNCWFEEIQTPMDLWNIKNRSYIELGQKVNKEVLNLRYEDILDDPSKVIQEIAENLHLNYDHTQFINIEESTKNDQKVYTDYRDYYLKERWRSELNEKNIKLINSQLDVELMDFFSYEKINFDPFL